MHHVVAPSDSSVQSMKSWILSLVINVTRHAILALKQMSSVLLVRTHSFGLKMMVEYVSVHAQTSIPITMETPMTEYVNRAAQIATSALVLMDALNALIINIIKLCFKQI
jgi:hypothetical protein